MDTTIVGALPKLPVVYEDRDNLRRAISAFEAGRISAVRREETTRATQVRVLAWQAEAGITLPGDGQIRWDDLLSPLALDIANLEPAGLLRFFNNNTYYRHPVITGRVWLSGRSIAGWAGEAAHAASGPLKASLPGPYTAARLSEDRQYHDLERLAADLADVIGMIAGHCLSAGAAVVELQEPSLALESDPRRVTLALDAIRRAATAAGGPVRLALYFGDGSAHLDRLAALGLDGVSFDLVDGPAGWDRLAADGFPGTVGLGLLDARDLRLETPESILPRLEKVARRIPPERLALHPNTSLEYLPADGAVRKLGGLRTLADALTGRTREVRA